MASVDQVYAYREPSRIRGGDGRTDLLLATSGGSSPAPTTPAAPHLYAGFLDHPDQAAAALLVCARVARTRFYVPPNMIAAAIRAADPVVTSNVDRLRFEAFSPDAGVYCRLDLLPESLSDPPIASGTTNVDFNPPMREALAQLTGREPLHLDVGSAGDVVVTTLDHHVVERRVPLPERWIRGFAEVQVASAAMRPALGLEAVEARRFLRTLPSETRRPLWVAPSGRSARTSTRPTPGAVCLTGAERLRTLLPLVRFATSLRAYGPPVDAAVSAAASAWQLDLCDARITVVLSPEVSRGFSGEGGLLLDLGDDEGRADADDLADRLGWDPHLQRARLRQLTGWDEPRVRRALVHLGASGRVGYDLADESFFHRELPFDPAVLAGRHPRLVDARELVTLGAVQPEAGGGARVASGDVSYRVTAVGTCTCPWWGRHRGTRGPCKHVLAARIASLG